MAEPVEVLVVPPATDRELSALLARLDPATRARLRALRVPEARAVAVAGHVALRYLVGAYLGLPVDRLPLRSGEHGRPEVEGAPRLGVSLTHTLGRAAVALHPDGQVGIDAEPTGRTLDPAVVERVCTRAELAVLRDDDTAVAPDLALRWWVRKEAVAKADGRGFGIGFAQLDVRAVGPVRRPGGGRAVHVHDLDLGDGHLGAIATVGPTPPVRVRWISRVADLLEVGDGDHDRRS